MTIINIPTGILPLATGLLTVLLIFKWLSATTYKLNRIPTVGASGILSSYRDAMKFNRHGHEMIDKGYRKYYGTAFKVSTMSRWLVVVSGPHMLEDIRRATDDQLSSREAAAELLQTDYTIGPHTRHDSYHVKVVATPLTRNYGARFSDLYDEIDHAFKDLIPANKADWVAVSAFTVVTKIVCRASNRLFVGLPLCRNEDWRNLNEQFTANVFEGAHFINMFPSLLKPIVGGLMNKISNNIRNAVVHVGPMIQARLEQDKTDHIPDDQQMKNDLISWLLEVAQGPQRRLEDLALRILNVNFASIHTTSMGLTNVLYDLAIHPEYVAPMREEVEDAIKSEGWTKISIGKMRKVDSFIKESQRLASGSFSSMRKVLKDFTFSNGVTVPAGTYLAIVALPTHLDENNYDNAQQFQGFRFADMREGNGEGIRHQMVALSPDYVVFGTGRHACPGRFFAVNELKAMLAYILLNYDIKMAKGDARPAGVWMQGLVSPSRTAEVMFRKRVL